MTTSKTLNKTTCPATPGENTQTHSDLDEAARAASFNRQTLLHQACDGRLLFRPMREGYYPGEIVTAQIYNPAGVAQGTERLKIEVSPGSGFAGQVYRALPLDGVFPAGQPLAIKVLRPRRRLKTGLRDFFSA